MANVTGQNVGHGIVYPRPDGYVAKCGGPAKCKTCARDLAFKQRNAQREFEVDEDGEGEAA